jgi:hypothetical protein
MAELVAPTRPEQAVRVVATTTALRARHGLELTPLDHARLDHWLASVRLRLGEADYAAVWADGQRETLECTIMTALELMETASMNGPASANSPI